MPSRSRSCGSGSPRAARRPRSHGSMGSVARPSTSTCAPARELNGRTTTMDTERTPAERTGEGFLTAEQQRRYGRYVDDPDRAQLDRYFHLDAAARELVDIRRGEHNRLGFAVQIGTVRFLGTFLADPTDAPWAVASHLAAQLGIVDPGVLKQYAAREGTNRLHAGEIQHAYGYRDFADPAVQLDLIGWLAARARLASERPGVLFDLATARLLEAKVLLPGPTVLARLVASVRDQAATRLWEALAAAPDAGQRARLEETPATSTGWAPAALAAVSPGPAADLLDCRCPARVVAGALWAYDRRSRLAHCLLQVIAT